MPSKRTERILEKVNLDFKKSNEKSGDKNNEPKYPEISQIDEEFRDELFEYLNKIEI